MLKHFIAFPDHKAPSDKNFSNIQPVNLNQFNYDDISMNGINSFLFDELMKVVGQATQTERISTFLSELSNFICKIRSCKPKLLHPNETTSEYFLDKYVSKVFDLPEGQIRFDEKAFDEHSQQTNEKFATFIDERPVTELATLNNIQELGYGINLFQQVNYDQISDNAVEAEALGEIHQNSDAAHGTPILDIPLDLFSFKNIE